MYSTLPGVFAFFAGTPCALNLPMIPRQLSLNLAALIFLFLAALKAQAQDPKTGIYLSVFKAGENTFWAQNTCQKIYNLAQRTDYPGAEVHCDWNQDQTFLSEKSKLARRSGAFQFMLELQETATDYRLRWVNWAPIDEVDVTQVSWTIKKQVGSDVYLAKLLNNLFEQKTYAMALRRNFVSQAILQKHGTAVRHPLSPSEINAFIVSDLKNKNYLKKALEAQLSLGLGVSDEVKNKEFARVAWEKEINSNLFEGSSPRQTLINWSKINSIFEKTLICRNGDLKDLDLLLCSQVATMTWNMILDYHGFLSFKNQALDEAIVSALAGALQAVEKLMTEEGSSIFKKNLQTIFKSPQQIDDLIPEKYLKKISTLNIIPENSSTKNRSTEIPLFKSESGPKKLITTLDFKSRFDNEFMNSIYQDFKTSLEIGMVAYNEKNLNPKDRAPLQGYNLFIGPKKALDNRTPFNLSADPRNSDFISSVHVFGSTLRMVTYSHGWRIQTVLDIYADFASVRSYALDQYHYTSDTNLEVYRTNRDDHYYAVGTTNLVQIMVENGRLSFDISAQNQQLSNMNGRSPQPNITGAAADNFTALEFGAQYRLRDGFYFRLALNETQRSGMIQDVGTRNNVNHAIIAQLIYRF